MKKAEPIYTRDLLNIVKANPGINTLELAEKLGVSPDYARWAVYESKVLEYYEGWHIRAKEGLSDAQV